MDPNLSSWMRTQHSDGIEREVVTYRAPGDRARSSIVRATRASLAALLFGLGERLSDQPRPVADPEPATRTP